MLTRIWLARFDYANLVIGEQIVGVRNFVFGHVAGGAVLCGPGTLVGVL